MMSKVRGQTIQQRLGFQDGDLKTPKHDEIMIWLDANLLSLLEKAGGWTPLWPEGTALECRARARDAVDQLMEKRAKSLSSAQENYDLRGGEKHYANQLRAAKSAMQEVSDWTGLSPAPVRPKWSIVDRAWEKPVISPGYRSKYIVGFIDLFATINKPVLAAYWETQYDIIKNLPHWNVYGDHYEYCFEIKSSIPSLGEVIRQIRMYQEYQKGRYVIVCPDDRFAEALKTQGIGFIKYEPDKGVGE